MMNHILQNITEAQQRYIDKNNINPEYLILDYFSFLMLCDALKPLVDEEIRKELKSMLKFRDMNVVLIQGCGEEKIVRVGHAPKKSESEN